MENGCLVNTEASDVGVVHRFRVVEPRRPEVVRHPGPHVNHISVVVSQPDEEAGRGQGEDDSLGQAAVLRLVGSVVVGKDVEGTEMDSISSTTALASPLSISCISALLQDGQ